MHSHHAVMTRHCLAMLSLACAASAFGALPRYTVHELPFNGPPGDTGYYSNATAINNADQVTAYRGQVGAGARGYRCSLATCEELPIISQAHHGIVQVSGINKDGMVVGTSEPSNIPYSWGFKWDGVTVTWLLPFFEGCEGCSLNSSAYRMNRFGQVAGSAQDSSRSEFPVIFNADGSKQKLPSFGGLYAHAADINDDGFVVGAAQNTDGNMRAFTFDGVQMTEIGTLGGSQSDARATNMARQVVGCSALAGDEQWQGFIFQGGTITPIPTVAGGGACPYDINSRGQVVGIESVAQTSFGTLYSKGRSVDLNKRLKKADKERWIIYAANGINTRGLIVAQGIDKTYGTRRAVVLVPVETAGEADDEGAPNAPDVSSGNAQTAAR